MGETICRVCDHMNWHIKAHRTGKCEKCGNPIRYCDSCCVPIPENGDAFGQAATKMIEKLKRGD